MLSKRNWFMRVKHKEKVVFIKIIFFKTLAKWL